LGDEEVRGGLSGGEPGLRGGGRFSGGEGETLIEREKVSTKSIDFSAKSRYRRRGAFLLRVKKRKEKKIADWEGRRGHISLSGGDEIRFKGTTQYEHDKKKEKKNGFGKGRNRGGCGEARAARAPRQIKRILWQGGFRAGRKSGKKDPLKSADGKKRKRRKSFTVTTEKSRSLRK